MFLSKKGLTYFLSFILIISLIANVYSFAKRNDISTNLRGKVNEYESEMKVKDNEITLLNKEISNLQKKKNDISNESESENETAENTSENEHFDVNKEMINTANRFIEYAFDTNPETFVTRKKLAQNFMTDNLLDTLYTSDGVDDDAQKISMEVSKVVVYIDDNHNDEAIIYYVVNEEILTSGYKETVGKYVKLKFIKDGNQIKVSNIEPLSISDGGI
ncbi:hypothetical protein [Sporosarcina sp. G11-34]|uniref:hypothetical protein n=1 Tax=Sporosarcina sp. G11-34 TaxID=2849605 RepID=UPI0022A9B532|nr:hypothetical protein [Sporosarcina sp. G11-34]MCZ2260753.1 hypothetical protein [Sporosarcina sp. G11-34]